MNRFTVHFFTCQLAGIFAMIMFSSDCVVGQQQVLFPLVPLGQYPFLSGFSTPSNPTTLAPSDDNPALSRKLVDNSNPSDTSFIDSCKGYVGNAALDCPCAAPGKRCADSVSLCKNGKCICDPALGYIDNAGKKCIRYATTTSTTTAIPATRAPCTCPTSAPCTTVTTPTTTALPTTTAAPDRRCGFGGAFAGFPAQDSTSCAYMNKGDTQTATIGTADYATFTFLGNTAVICPGGSFQVDIDKVFPDIPDCNQAFVNIYGTPLCHQSTPSRITIPAPIFSVAVFIASTAGNTGGMALTVTCV